MGKLTARQVETIKAPGRHADGGNLYLNVSPHGTKSWVFFYRFAGKQREMGLGSYQTSTLAQARVKALSALKLLRDGLDPLAAKRVAERAEAGNVTFGPFADDYIATHRVKFRNQKHAAQWKTTLGPKYCAPIRSLAIGEVDTAAVLRVLKPLWQKVPETASRIRGRIENVLDAARAQGLYAGENPARWKGHLKAVLPARQRLTRGHHAALSYDEIPAFMESLRESQTVSIGARALEFCILTVTRTNETLGAQWAEFDLKKHIWTIPAARMKSGIEHRIPLSTRAVAILQDMEHARTTRNEHVFPGLKNGAGLSNMAMSAVLKRMQRESITVHGFRSTFRDWASEQTSFPHETCEHALAHQISDKAEAAYRRGDQFEKRWKLMEAWEVFCRGSTAAKLLKIHTVSPFNATKRF
jgi:integrase